MNEDFNIEKLEALLRKAQESHLNEDEIKFLEENGIHQDTISFMAQATSHEKEVEFLHASQVKTEVLKHFKEKATNVKSETVTESHSKKIFNFTPLLKYAAIFIVSLGALATTYFVMNFDKINNENVAINEPTPKHNLEEVTLGIDIPSEDSINNEVQNNSVVEKKSSIAPPPKSPELYSAAIETETKPVGIIANSNSPTTESLSDDMPISDIQREYTPTNTIVRAERSIAPSEERVLSKKNKENTLIGSSNISDKYDSQEVGPYPGGLAQLKVDLKKEINSTKKYAEDSRVSVTVIPAGDGTLKDVEINSTNDAQFAADVVAALKRLKNWENANTRKQNYLFFALDFN